MLEVWHFYQRSCCRVEARCLIVQKQIFYTQLWTVGTKFANCGKGVVVKMNKYEVLEEKLNNVKECIAKMKVSSEATQKYLAEFEDYVDRLIVASHEKKICNSDGALLGLMRGISDYDELCANDELWISVREADIFYSRNCNVF